MRHPGKPGRRGRARRRWLYTGLAPLIAVLLAVISAASGFAPQAAASTRSAAAQPVTTIGYALSGPSNDGGYYQNQAQEIVKLGHQRGIKVIVAQNADPNSATVFEDLARHPRVLEAAVVGRPDVIRDEVPVGYVVCAPGATDLTSSALADWCAQRLAPAKRPRDIYFVPELPRTSVGKIRKFLLAGQPELAAPPSAPDSRGKTRTGGIAP